MSEELRFRDEGSHDQLPVIFLHAFPFHGAMWDAQHRALVGQARCITLDSRGIGPGAAAPHPYMLEHLVDDLFALLDRLSIQSCALCGLSMGGYVALRAVQRSPERVRGLVLADTQAAADPDEAKLARAEGLRVLWSKGREEFATMQLKRQLSPHTWAQRPELVSALAKLIADSSAEGIAANLVAIATRTDLRAALPSFRVPTRILVGADDAVTPPTAARAMADAIPGADLHVLERAGHLSNVEAEPAFNQLLVEHLAKLR